MENEARKKGTALVKSNGDGVEKSYAAWVADLKRRVLAALSVLMPLLGLNAAPTFTIQDGTLKAVELNGATAVNIPSEVASIGDNTFMGLTSLRCAVIPNGVTNIGNNAFYGCTSLIKVNIPYGVMAIGDWAFKDCSRLTGISIPGSVTRIGGDAFSGCGFTYTGNYGYGCFAGDYGATTGPGIPNVTWTIHDGELTDVELNGETDIIIPSAVTSIGENAFRYCHDLSSVIIPDSVTSIGERAFEGCNGLRSVTIGNGVTSIGREVFYNCSGLTNVTIGNNVTSIGYRAFYGCSGLTSVMMPSCVTTIGERAFDCCRGLTSVVIGNGVTNVGNYAFLACSSLMSITIPASVTSIGNGAFAECFNLTSVLFLGNMPDCGSDAFKAVANSMNVPNGCLAYVNDSVAFPKDGDIWNNLTVRKIPLPRDADSLSRVTFTIADNGRLMHVALNGATFVLIPRSVTCISYDAFDDCGDMTTVLIPSSVTSIDGRAFRNCGNLTNAVVIASAMSINEYRLRIENNMFQGCDNLTSVTMGQGIASIGSCAFADCRELTSVTIPDSVTNIGEWAFYGCSGLSCVTIPDSVAGVGAMAFYGCSGLAAVYIDDLAAWCRISFAGYGSNPLHYAHNLYLNGDLVTDLTIPDSVTSIGRSAFSCCTNLTSVSIPASVTSIGKEAFYGCSKLTAVCIADLAAWCGISFADYDSNPLYYVHNLYLNGSLVTDLTMPDGVTSIGKCAFYGCSGLKSVTIPDSVTSIGNGAFSGCGGLTSFVVGCNNANYSSVDRLLLTRDGKKLVSGVNGVVSIPGSVTSIEPSAFSGCSGLTDIVIGNGVTSIGNYAFRDCSGLKCVAIPDGVTNIGDYAFYYCSRLENVLIPGSVASIGYSAFRGCSGLTNVTFLGNAPEMDSYVFTSVDLNCVASVSPKSTGWGIGVGEKWYGLTVQYWPEILTVASSDTEVGEIVAAFADKELAAQVTNKGEYDAFRAWVNNNNLHQPTVVDCKNTWLSYALGADALIDKELASDDVKIESFVPTSTDGRFEFTVSVKDVNIGSGSVEVETLKENLKKALGVEGASALTPDAFSSDNVDITLDAPVDGKARFTVSSRTYAGDSFFMRVKVK